MRHSTAPAATNSEGGNEKAAAGDRALGSSLPPGWPWPDDVVSASSYSPRERRIALCEYGSGYAAGLERGRLTAEAEAEAAWSQMADSVRRAGGAFAGLRFSELCELRGEREAADLARVRERLLFERTGEAS